MFRKGRCAFGWDFYNLAFQTKSMYIDRNFTARYKLLRILEPARDKRKSDRCRSGIMGTKYQEYLDCSKGL